MLPHNRRNKPTGRPTKKQKRIEPVIYMGTAPKKMKNEQGEPVYFGALFISDGPVVGQTTSAGIIKNIIPSFVDRCLMTTLENGKAPIFEDLNMKSFRVMGENGQEIAVPSEGKDKFGQSYTYDSKVRVFTFTNDGPITQDTAIYLVDEHIQPSLEMLRWNNKPISTTSFMIDNDNFWLGNISIGETIGSGQVKQYVAEEWSDFCACGRNPEWTKNIIGLIKNLWPKGSWTWKDAFFFDVPYEFCSVEEIKKFAKNDKQKAELLKNGHNIGD